MVQEKKTFSFLGFEKPPASLLMKNPVKLYAHRKTKQNKTKCTFDSQVHTVKFNIGSI